MSDHLDRLAESHGIQLAYVSEMGERRQIDDAAKRSLLGALGAGRAAPTPRAAALRLAGQVSSMAWRKVGGWRTPRAPSGVGTTGGDEARPTLRPPCSGGLPPGRPLLACR